MVKIRVQAEEGNVTKCLPSRILPGTDLIQGIEALCKKYGISYGYVSCIGSLQNASYRYLVKNSSVKMNVGYGDAIYKQGPIEFLNGTGFICLNENGEFDIHFHATMCDQNGVVFGGHMVRGENLALTTLDVMIFEVANMQMIRKYDEETDLTQFFPSKDE